MTYGGKIDVLSWCHLVQRLFDSFKSDPTWEELPTNAIKRVSDLRSCSEGECFLGVEERAASDRGGADRKAE